MIDTKALLAGIDLADVIAGDLGQPVKRSGKYVFWRCPFHEDASPSFAVTPDRYHCFGCGESGDAVAWMMKYKRLTFLDACTRLSAGNLPKIADISTARSPQTILQRNKPLPDDLQDVWRQVIDVCQDQLWSDAGQKAQNYLHGRGLTDVTLKSPFFRVGYSTGQKIAGQWVDRGIVLPCFEVGDDLAITYVNYIKIRRPADNPKYKKLPGNGADLVGLYGASACQGADVIVVTEGEFDALLLRQEAGDLVGVYTLGGATDRFDWSRWGKYFAFVKWILVAYDADQAGEKGADVWRQLSGRVIKVNLPEGKGKDITDLWKNGVNLSDWMMTVLHDTGISVTKE